MSLPATLRRPFSLLATIVVTTLACGLLTATIASASPESRAELRAQRAEERATRRQERETRRNERQQQRASRQAARHDVEPSTGEEGTTTTTPVAPHADRGCSLTLSVSSPHVLAGETVTVSGTVSCPTKAAAASQHVSLYERKGGATGTPQTLETLTPTGEGTFTATSPALESNTVFQVREGRHRARAVVRVAPAITLSVAPPAASATTAGTRHNPRTVVTFTGTLTPASPGALVALQVQEGERWHSIGWGHAAADGSFAINHSFKSAGTNDLRAIAHSGRGHALAISEPISYEATQPQNQQLTIASSANPIASGQSVTISGVAGGASNAPVKLLARVKGGLFAVVAEGTTDAEGAYSFTQSPLTSTIYRVTDALTRSTALFEDVTSTPPASPTT